VLLGGAAEFARAYPYTLAFFNHLVGGPANGYRYLADSNLGWGGNLKRLKQWMERHRIGHANLAYFGQADPGYYEIGHTHLPGAPGFAIEAIARPRLPGYVALSPTIMHGVYSPPHWQMFYAPFRDLEPAAVIGNSLRVYWVERWPEAVGESADRFGIDAHRTLGDALLFGMQWPTRAELHYREYLRRRPQDADALLHLGIALAAEGRDREAVSTLQAAVRSRTDHGPARLTLARALFGSRDVAGAALHAEYDVRLLPNSADAHDLLGRVRAVQGRYVDAELSFRRAVEIDPSHQEAREHLARVRSRP
jgi:tetratricopeptide (TPR) repeat protein